MKQCGRGLPPFAVGSSSLSFGASESDPEDSLWSDFTFDFSFLTSEDQKNALDDDSSRLADSITLPKAADDRAEGRFGSSSKSRMSKDISGSNSTPLLSKISCSNAFGIDKQNLCSANTTLLLENSSIPPDQDESDLDSPCWRGTPSHNSAASGTNSLSYRRSSSDLNALYGLNPLAPQFVPSNPIKKLDKNVREFELDSSSSFKKSLSSTFPPPSGEICLNDPSEQGSSQNSRIGISIHDADESFGLISQDSFCKTMSIVDIGKESKKLDPLAPLFVPATPKLSAVVHEKHGVADHMVAIEANAPAAYALNSPDDMLLSNVRVETHSSEVNHGFKNPYSNSVHESGTPYSFNHRLGSQVQISENTKLDSSSNTTNGPKKLNPLAPQFSLPETKPKVYGCEENQAATHLLPKLNNSLSSLSNVKALSDFGQRYGCSTSSPSPKMDVKKLLTTIHGLSELLLHVHRSESSDSPNELDLDLINCTVQNLNLYISSSAQEHSGSYSNPGHSSCDIKLLPNICKRSVGDHQLPRVKNMSANADVKRKAKYSMVSGEMVPDHDFASSVTKENGFGKVIGNHQTEEQINPQVFFYRSLWLKAKADRSLMEYEAYLSRTRA